MKLFNLGLMIAATASLALAGSSLPTAVAPEINAQSATAALALLGGGLLILRTRKK